MADPSAPPGGSSPVVAAPLSQDPGREPCAVGLVVEVGSLPVGWPDTVGHVEVVVGWAAHPPGRAEAVTVGQAGDAVVLEVAALVTGGAAAATGGAIGGATGASGTSSTPRA